MLDDSAVDLEAWLADEVEGEFAKQEGIAHLSGNGVNKPFGLPPQSQRETFGPS